MGSSRRRHRRCNVNLRAYVAGRKRARNSSVRAAGCRAARSSRERHVREKREKHFFFSRRIETRVVRRELRESRRFRSPTGLANNLSDLPLPAASAYVRFYVRFSLLLIFCFSLVRGEQYRPLSARFNEGITIILEFALAFPTPISVV